MTASGNSTVEIDRNNTSRFKTFLKEKLLPLLFKQFMMIGILIGLFVGLVAPQLGAWVGSFTGSTYICIIIVFLHSGLKLKTAAMKDAIKEYKGFLFGLISIMLITSLIGTKLTQLLPFGESVTKSKNGNRTSSTSDDSIVGPKEFLLGLELYYISPCAVASGIVLTSLAGGDVTLALLLTLTTNTLGVVTVPLMATWLVSVKEVQINVVLLLVKLACTVLVPLIIGKAATRINVVKTFVNDHTKTLKIISITFLVCIPWMKISKAKLTGSFQTVSFLSLVILLFWGLALHLGMIIFNYVGAWVIRVNLAVRKTLVVLASTKTLAITLSLLSFLPPELGDAGLMSLPLIVVHLSLLLIDSAWVVHWNTNEQNEVVASEEDGSCQASDNHVSLLQTENNTRDSCENHDTSV